MINKKEEKALCLIKKHNIIKHKAYESLDKKQLLKFAFYISKARKTNKKISLSLGNKIINREKNIIKILFKTYKIKKEYGINSVLDFVCPY
jgi:hypothetical protein